MVVDRDMWKWALGLGVIGSCLLLVPSSWAVDETDSEIIGYQPIPNSALPDVTARPSGYGYGTTAAMAPTAMLPGAQGFPAAPAASTPAGYNYITWMVGEGPYTLGRDDVLQVDVRNQPLFSGQFVVGPDGYIQYTYLGDIPVAGMTKYEVQQILTKLLEEYIRSPIVSVTIVAYNSKAVYIVGEVARPGRYLMRGDVIKLREAIMAAGLPTPYAALWRTHIVKPDLEESDVRRVNLKKILYDGKLAQDVNLYPGEIVVVPSTVLSAVNRFLSQLLNPFTRAASAASIGACL